MKYNFDVIIPRRGTGCVKWDSPCSVLSGPSPSSSVLGDSAAEAACQAASRPLIPLWVADMDFAVAPAIQEAIKHRAEHPIFGYTHVQDDYYEAVISWFKRRHQWHIQREWILYTTGVVPAMSVAIKALTMPGEKVLILSPDYNCFFSSIRNNGCEVAECVLRFSRSNVSETDESRLLRFPRSNDSQADSHSSSIEKCNHNSQFSIVNSQFSIPWDDFESLCADETTTVFLLCNPHNPTGRVWTREELQRMANVICQDAETRRRLDRAININEVCDVNPFAPEAVKAAYNDSEDWLDALNRYLWDNYRALCDFVAQHLPQWRVMPLEGTYLVWVDVSAAIAPSGFAAGPSAATVPDGSPSGSPATVCCDSVATYCDRLLQQTGVWLNPGTMYGPVSGEGYLRINIACPRSLLMEALERISALSV